MSQYKVTIQDTGPKVTVIDEKIIVKVVDEIVKVVTVAEQGPPGPPGSTEYITVKGGVGGVNAFQLVIITLADTVQAANALEPSHAGRVVGMVTENIAEGVDGKAQTAGEVTNPLWNLVPGSAYFLASGGEIGVDIPVTGFIQRVGVAKNATKLLLSLSEPILI